MTRPSTQSAIPAANAEDRAISDRLRAILEHCTDLVADPDALARRLAPMLVDAGIVVSDSNVPTSPSSTSDSGSDPIEAHILMVIDRHPAGRSPGLAPDMLARLTGIAGTQLAQAVSSLVQGGELIRDAWLVRLPESSDLLPQATPAGRDEHGMEGAAPDSERRVVGDRRAVGERRLYDRRGLRQ